MKDFNGKELKENDEVLFAVTNIVDNILIHKGKIKKIFDDNNEAHITDSKKQTWFIPGHNIVKL